MHRDIKPQNILIDSNCMVTLCDFGLARTLPETVKPSVPLSIKCEAGPESDTEDTSPTTSDEIPNLTLKHKRRLSYHISSRWYRAPEVILMNENYNSQVDMWGLGCMLAEMMLLLVGKNVKTESKVNLSDLYLFPGKTCFPLTPNMGK